jgi:hypothetical protein
MSLNWSFLVIPLSDEFLIGFRFFAAEQQYIGSNVDHPNSKAPQGRNIMVIIWFQTFKWIILIYITTIELGKPNLFLAFSCYLIYLYRRI